MKRNFTPFAFLKEKSVTLLLAFSLLLTQSLSAQPYSIWTTGDIPTDIDLNDGQGIEVGFKFKVTQIGTLQAIRFYKGPAGSGTYTVNLWTNTGSNLSTASAVLGATGGWFQIDIPDVVLLTNTVYVISYHTATGFYSVDNNYFPVTPDQPDPPFIIVSYANDPAGIGNGVYSYSATSTFPNNTPFNPANYWIDPVFQPTFPLPVTLTGFEAAVSNKDVQLTWKTKSEQNNRGFDIQRSNNGSDWYSIGFVDGVGESTTTRNYSYSDKGLAPGLYYYRLNQKDFDGGSKISSVVTATIGGRGIVSLHQNYPNPVRKSTTIRFDLPTTQKIRLSVIDLSGKEVKVLADKKAESGTHLVTLDASLLSRQTYIIRLQTESGILTKKFLVN